MLGVGAYTRWSKHELRYLWNITTLDFLQFARLSQRDNVIARLHLPARLRWAFCCERFDNKIIA